MLEVADTLPDSGRGEYFRTSEYVGTSLLVSFRAADSAVPRLWLCISGDTASGPCRLLHNTILA